MKRSYFLWT